MTDTHLPVEPQQHWLAAMIERWLSGWMIPDEIAMLFFLALVLHAVNYRIYKERPRLLRWAGRAGFGTFCITLAWFISCDRGIESAGMRVLMSTALGWFLAGLVGVMVLPMVSAGEIFLVAPLERAKRFAEKRRLSMQEAEAARRAELQRERICFEQMERQRVLDEQKEKEAAEREQRRQQQLEQVERERPERERRQRELDAEQAEKARIEAEHQKQIADLRYDVELVFERCRPTLYEFTDERFWHYLDRHLDKNLSVEKFRERADKLKVLLQQLANVRSNALPVFQDLEEVIQHFSNQKRRLMSLDLDEDTLETLALSIDDERDRVIRSFL